MKTDRSAPIFNSRNASSSGGGTLTCVRLRTSQDRLKIEHSIIDGLRRVLEKLLEQNAGIRSIVPGRISVVRDAKGPVVKVRVTVPVTNGWKAIALAAGARQEMFVSTNFTKEALRKAFVEAGAAPAGN